MFGADRKFFIIVVIFWQKIVQRLELFLQINLSFCRDVDLEPGPVFEITCQSYLSILIIQWVILFKHFQDTRHFYNKLKKKKISKWIILSYEIVKSQKRWYIRICSWFWEKNLKNHNIIIFEWVIAKVKMTSVTAIGIFFLQFVQKVRCLNWVKIFSFWFQQM